ncbi:MAG TPA: TonB-dependent receptor [Longimicrobiales bacterium]
MRRDGCQPSRRSNVRSAWPAAAFVVLGLVCLAADARAQASAAITGRVTNDVGAPLAGAQVTIPTLGRSSLTRANGDYAIEGLEAGTYTLEVRMIGFRTMTAEVTLTAGQRVVQDFALASDPLKLDALVVTGTQVPRQKLDASVAVTVLSSEDVEQAAPRSTTEMLRFVPGFTRVESSGGEVNQNISMRGILGVEYVMFMEDGLPVFPTMHTFFMNADNLFRPDENIQRVEVVRGGSSALFGSNTPGAIINFINRTGGPEFSGTMKATAGTEGLARYDFNAGGPMGEDWRFNLGGFYRYDHGVRDPGFPGIRGGQLKASITRVLDRGYVRASLKMIDDRNQFILPLPFQNKEDPEYVPGFSDYGSMNTLEGNHIRVPLPSGDQLDLPLEDGLRTKAYWLTANAAFDLDGGWHIENAAQIMSNDQGWNAIVPGDVMTADAAVRSFLEQAYGTYYKGVLQASGILPADADVADIAENTKFIIEAVPGFDYTLRYPNVRDATGQPVAYNAANGLLAPGGEWHVEKPMSAFQNQFQIRKTFGEHSISAGVYFANYSQTNRWYFTDILMDVRDNPHFVDMFIESASLRYRYIDPVTGEETATTVTVGDIEATKNGFRRFLSNYVNGTGQSTIVSGVLGGAFQLTDRLRADVGVRYEWNDFVQTSENTSTVDLDGVSGTLYDAEPWGNGSFRHFSRSLSDWAASIGLNYEITDQVSVYAQGGRAYKMPALDEYLNAAAVEQVELFDARNTLTGEGGVKFASDRVSFTVNGFYTLLKNIVGQGAVTDPVTGATTWVINTAPENRSYGAELEATAQVTDGLYLVGNGTFLKAELGSGAGSDIGSWINGVPPVIGNLAAFYSQSNFSVNVDWHYVGRRYTDFQNNLRLPAYNYTNLGVSYAVPGTGITIAANLLNAFQSKGLEEGNPRLVAGPTSDLFLARPVLPRRLMASLRYDF